MKNRNLRKKAGKISSEMLFVKKNKHFQDFISDMVYKI
jgi:hypothetical protein